MAIARLARNAFITQHLSSKATFTSLPAAAQSHQLRSIYHEASISVCA
jgi:hypothetical protein